MAEDLRAQILGQLSERLNYDRLYQEALSDWNWKRTQVELEAALSEFPRSAAGGVRPVPRPQRLQPRRLQALLGRVVQSGSTGALSLAAVVDRQQKLVKVDDATCDLVTAEGTCHARFTLRPRRPRPIRIICN